MKAVVDETAMPVVKKSAAKGKFRSTMPENTDTFLLQFQIPTCEKKSGLCQ